MWEAKQKYDWQIASWTGAIILNANRVKGEAVQPHQINPLRDSGVDSGLEKPIHALKGFLRKQG